MSSHHHNHSSLNSRSPSSLNGSNGTAATSNNNNEQTSFFNTNLNESCSSKKNALENWPKSKKINKISHYSSCQAEECKCNGFKSVSTVSGSESSRESLCKTCSHTQTEHIQQYDSFNNSQINQILQNVLDVETLFSLILKEEDADTKQIYYFLFKLLRKGILNSIDLNRIKHADADSSYPSQNNSFNNSETGASPNAAGYQSSASVAQNTHNPHQNTSLTVTTSNNNFKNSPTSVEAHLGKPPFEEPSIIKSTINFLFFKY